MARQKHVFPTGEIAHLWAHQTQADARNPQSNFSFEGADLYSYSTVIARLHSHKTRGQFALLSEHRYSVTTAAHLSDARGAVSHMARADVPKVQPYGANDHGINIAHLEAVAAGALKTAKRAMQSHTVQWRRAEAATALERAGAYMKFFGIRRKAPVFPAAEWDAAAERARSIEAPDPVRDAKRFKAREAREASQQRALQKAFDTYCAQVAAYNEVFNAAAAQMPEPAAHWRDTGEFPRLDLGQERVFLPHDMARKLRRAGFELPAVASNDRRPAGVLLRLEGEQIVSSMGARIPADHAPRIWALVQACRSTGREYKRNGHTEHAGAYAIDSVDAAGTMRAGCHTIAYEELALLAARMGLA